MREEFIKKNCADLVHSGFNYHFPFTGREIHTLSASWFPDFYGVEIYGFVRFGADYEI